MFAGLYTIDNFYKVKIFFFPLQGQYVQGTIKLDKLFTFDLGLTFRYLKEHIAEKWD